MYFIHFSYIIFILLLLKPLNAMEMPDLPPFKFLIGFEFQEDSNLCSHLPHWAKDDVVIQKSPIFTLLNEKGNKLWHLEIDGADIEFVTAPFSIEVDKHYLDQAISTIEKSCSILKRVFEKKREPVTLQEWIDTLELEMCSKGDTLLKKSEKVYQTVKDETLKTPYGWKPKFTPQVTVQHSLAYTIPLAVSLFGNKNRPTKIMEKLFRAFPFTLNMEQLIDNNNYFNTENGLLFLHALTCSSIQSFSSNNLIGMLNSLNTIKENFEMHKQADPKVGLDFLSRRPFSMMWTDVKKAKNNNDSFEELYKERILEGNPLFAKEVAPHFKFVNYAEEYYHGENHERKDLSNLEEKFGELAALSKQQPNDPLSFLLKKGILSTGMAGYLDPNLFDNYLQECVKTVDAPSHTYVFDPKTNSIKKVISNVDSLSPPWLIEQPNSMGYYRYTDEFDTGYSFNIEHGEVVLELRSIKTVSRDALTAMNINPLEAYGHFLTGERSLLEDVNSLLLIMNEGFILNTCKEIIKSNSVF